MRLFLALLVPALLLPACGETTVAPYDAGDVSNHYLPLSAGSTWTYGGDIAKTVVVSDTVIDGVSYAVLNSPDESSLYVRREGDTYYQRTSSDEETILLMERDVNMTWTHNVAGPNGTRLYTDYTIISLDERRVVNGRVYDDLMHVLVTYKTEEPGKGRVQTGLVARYYARGVGLIEEITIGVGSVREMLLASSTVINSNVEPKAVAENEVDGGRAAATIDSRPWAIRRVGVDTIAPRISLASGYRSNGIVLSIEPKHLEPGLHAVEDGGIRALYTQPTANRFESALSGELEILTMSPQQISGRFSIGLESGMVVEGEFVVDR